MLFSFCVQLVCRFSNMQRELFQTFAAFVELCFDRKNFIFLSSAGEGCCKLVCRGVTMLYFRSPGFGMRSHSLETPFLENQLRVQRANFGFENLLICMYFTFD